MVYSVHIGRERFGAPLVVIKIGCLPPNVHAPKIENIVKVEPITTSPIIQNHVKVEPSTANIVNQISSPNVVNHIDINSSVLTKILEALVKCEQKRM